MKAYQANGTVIRSRFVKIDATDNNAVLACGANEGAVGISMPGGREAPIPSVTADPPEAAQAGDQLTVFTLHDEDAVLLEAGAGGFTAGDQIESGAGGVGITAVTTSGTVRNIGAIAVETAAAGELGRVLPVMFTHTNP